METITLTKKAIKSAQKSFSRKRPNKAYLLMNLQSDNTTPIEKAKFKTALYGMEVKNELQRINTRTLSSDKTLTIAQCVEIQRAMKAFIQNVDNIINK